MPIPATVDDLTTGWFSDVLGSRVSGVVVLDAHSGTTGRARLALTGSGDLPAGVFVKLAPSTEHQRAFLLAPRVWHAAHDAADGSFVMVLEDLAATGCRFPADAETAARRSQLIRSALDQFGAEMGPALRKLAQTYIERSGDVAYFLCNSLPTATRRAEQDALIERYQSALGAHGWTLGLETVQRQYRIFAIYAWVAAVSAAAMGTQWQPAEITRLALRSTTAAIEDLDVLGLLGEEL